MKYRRLAEYLLLLTMIVGLMGVQRHARGEALQDSHQETSTFEQPPLPDDQIQLGPDVQVPPHSTQIVTGKIVESQNRLVLIDQKTRTLYLLENSEPARRYVGKRVAVRGNIDLAANVIHILDINPTSNTE